MELLEAWECLDTDGELQGSHVRLRISLADECAVYAARRTEDSTEALILKVRTSSLPPDIKYPSSAGLEVITQPEEPGRHGSTRIILGLLDSRFREVFRSLCEDLAPRLCHADSDQACVATLVEQLERWQAFLRKFGARGLSREARLGLLGELVFLRDCLIPRTQPLAAVNAWRGPGGGPHDFLLPRGSVEVKTTSANSPHAFRVSNVRQLDDTGIPHLYLYLAVVGETEAGGVTLSELIRAIRDDLDGEACGLFDENLIACGYLQRQDALYRSPRYVVRSIRLFEVAEGFPRLLEQGIPDGVEEVRYSVAIAGCASYRRELDPVLDALVISDDQRES